MNKYDMDYSELTLNVEELGRKVLAVVLDPAAGSARKRDLI